MNPIIRLVITGVLVLLWFVSQKAISRRVFPSQGIHDKIHSWTSPINKKLLENKNLSRGLLITSSLGIDLLVLWLCVDSIFGPSFAPMIGLFLLFSLRQLCQYLSALPPPEGMIWFNPGVRSLFVTYGVTNDLFFSGHTAIAVYGGLQLVNYSNPALQALAIFLILYEIITVLILRAHWTIDVFTGIITALWIDSLTKTIMTML